MSIRNLQRSRPKRPQDRIKRRLLASFLAMGIYSFPSAPVVEANEPIAAQEAHSTDQTEVEAHGARVLKLTPAGEPSPALRYRFWPDRFEMQPGNAFVRFQRAILLMKNAMDNSKANGSWSDVARWIETPIEDFPTDSVREFLTTYQEGIAEAHEARLLRDSEYDLGAENLRGARALDLPLPEIQEMRSLARLLQLQVRLQVAEGKIDEAIETLQVGFRLGEATGQAADFLIARLVGLTITSNMLKEVETCIQHKDCPNLYWALATLPPTSSEVEESIAFESAILVRYFPELDNLPDEGLPAETWRQRLTKTLINLNKIEDNTFLAKPEEEQDNEVAMRLGMTILALSESSRRQLVDDGISEGRVSKMSPEEIVVRATASSLKKVQDDLFKWTLIPKEMRPYYLRYAEARLPFMSKTNIADSIAKAFLPAISPTLSLGERVNLKIAELATIESIRNHIFVMKQLPEQIDIWNVANPLSLLPVWPDPISGNQFSYQKLDNSSAELSSWEQSPFTRQATSIILKF